MKSDEREGPLRRGKQVVPVFLSILAIFLAYGAAVSAKADDHVVLSASAQGRVEIAQAAPLPAASPAAAGRPVQAPPPIPTPAPQSPAAVPPRTAPPTAGLVQMQFDNIELRDMIRFVSNIMGKNFIYDETVVKGRVTVLSPKASRRKRFSGSSKVCSTIMASASWQRPRP